MFNARRPFLTVRPVDVEASSGPHEGAFSDLLFVLLKSAVGSEIQGGAEVAPLADNWRGNMGAARS
jgi:hypothetical protein